MKKISVLFIPFFFLSACEDTSRVNKEAVLNLADDIEVTKQMSSAPPPSLDLNKAMEYSKMHSVDQKPQAEADSKTIQKNYTPWSNAIEVIAKKQTYSTLDKSTVLHS